MTVGNMPAISLWQPWASLVAIGAKQVETRGWRPPRHLIGKRIAIAATATLPADGREALRPPIGVGALSPILTALRAGGHHISWDRRQLRHDLPLGCVVATARLVDAFPTMNVQVSQERGIRRDYGWGPLILDVTRLEWAFGDYSLGRYAWLLGDIERLDPPVPAKGKQGWWTWAPTPHIGCSSVGSDNASVGQVHNAG